MYKVITLIIIAAVLSGCATSFGPRGGNSAQVNGNDVPYAGYIAINPISLPHDLFSPRAAIVPAAGAAPAGAVAPATAQPDPDLSFLINNAARVSIQEITANGEIKYFAAGVSTKNSYYHATIDYIKYHSSSIKLPVHPRRVNSPTDERELSVILGVAVGVGLRAEATFFSNEAGANIADIVNIGASAQAKKISGTMAFQTMGVESKAISDTLPIPSELSSSTIQNAMQTMATVKANIYSPETSVVPQVVGIEIQSYPDGVDITDVIRALHRSKVSLIDQVKEELDKRQIRFERS